MLAEIRSGRSDIKPSIAYSRKPPHHYGAATLPNFTWSRIFVLQRKGRGMPLELAADEFGSGPPVAILHGLFGSGRNWRSVAQHLAARHRVLTFDLRNHGASPWSDGMSYGEMVEDLRTSFRARGLEHASLLGHSMGGKVAMLMALLHPDEVGRLVVVDIAPAANPPNLLVYIRAMRAVDLRGVTRRAAVEAPGSMPTSSKPSCKPSLRSSRPPSNAAPGAPPRLACRPHFRYTLVPTPDRDHGRVAQRESTTLTS